MDPVHKDGKFLSAADDPIEDAEEDEFSEPPIKYRKTRRTSRSPPSLPSVFQSFMSSSTSFSSSSSKPKKPTSEPIVVVLSESDSDSESPLRSQESQKIHRKFTPRCPQEQVEGDKDEVDALFDSPIRTSKNIKKQHAKETKELQQEKVRTKHNVVESRWDVNMELFAQGDSDSSDESVAPLSPLLPSQNSEMYKRQDTLKECVLAWTCPLCTTRNPLTEDRCTVCDGKDNFRKESKGNEKAEKEWNCRRCTLLNKPEARKCDVCEYSREDKEKKEPKNLKDFFTQKTGQRSAKDTRSKMGQEEREDQEEMETIGFCSLCGQELTRNLDKCPKCLLPLDEACPQPYSLQESDTDSLAEKNEQRRDHRSRTSSAISVESDFVVGNSKQASTQQKRAKKKSTLSSLSDTETASNDMSPLKPNAKQQNSIAKSHREFQRRSDSFSSLDSFPIVVKTSTRSSTTSNVEASWIKASEDWKDTPLEQPWSDLHQPTTKEDLVAVLAKDKVTSVENWLDQALAGTSHRLLVLHGPIGCGKSTTVKVLAQEKNVSIREWRCESDFATTTNFAVDKDDPLRLRSDMDIPYVSQLADFEHFVRDVRFPPLQLTGQSSAHSTGSSKVSLLLIDHLPAVSDPSKRTRLHEILQGLVFSTPKQSHRIITVIIFSSGGESVNPKDIRRKLSEKVLDSAFTCQIAFNPIPPTKLRKTLDTVVARQGVDIPAAQLDNIVLSANGDLRNALLQLQFTSLGYDRIPTKGNQKSKTRKRLRKEVEGGKEVSFRQEDSERDGSLTINHAVGKLLRGKTVGEVYDGLSGRKKSQYGPPPSKQERVKVAFDPDSVAARCPLDPGALCDFVEHNCVQYMTCLEDIAQCLDVLTLADQLESGGSRLFKFSSEFAQHGALYPGAYVSAIGSRAAFALREGELAKGFKTVKTPSIYELRRRVQTDDSADLFSFTEHTVDRKVLEEIRWFSNHVLTESTRTQPRGSLELPQVDNLDDQIEDFD